MYAITLRLDENHDVFEFINLKFNHFLIHQFNPNYSSDFYTTSIANDYLDFNNITLRNLSFDIWADQDILKKIITVNTPYINIYQFDRKLPESIVLERLDDNVRDKILQQNGLQHKYFINQEFISIYSFDEEYINKINANPKFSSLVVR